MRFKAFAVALGLLAAPSFAGQRQPHAAGPAPVPRQAKEPGGDRVNRADTQPVLTVDKLSRMTPDGRAKALSKLPEERRAAIEKRLADFEKMPAAQQERVRQRLEKLNALPQPRQREVRQSMRDFNALPADRKPVLNKELKRMQGMAADERKAYTGTGGFHKRFSRDERRIMDNLLEIMPAQKQ